MEISCGASIAVESKGGGLCMDFARDELKSHLLAMFNRLDFDAKKPETKILLEVRNSPVLRHDGYQILITEQGARITSRMERGVLHGVYHLLRMLGCSFWFSKTSVQIVPTVRYWLPHVRIISPEGWQKELEEDMRAYLGGH